MDDLDFDEYKNTNVSDNLIQFVEKSKRIVKEKFESFSKTDSGKTLLFISADTLSVANVLYKNIKSNTIQLFSTDDVQSIVIERMIKSAETKDSFNEMKKDR